MKRDERIILSFFYDMSETGSEKLPEVEAWNRLVALLSKRDWLVVGWALGIKCLLFLFAAESYRILENKPLPYPHGWLEIWNRWDSLHYQRLAQFGYTAKDSLKAWFYPLFPWSVRVIAQITGDYLVSAFIVAGIASVAAAVLLQRLVELDFSSSVAQRSVWFFLIFPTAYFLHIGYTESLFLALTLGCLLAARTNRWWLAGMLGAFCWMTRAPGVVLIPTLAVEAIQQYCVEKRWQWRWLWIAVVPAGFGVYLLVNLQVTGDAFSFLWIRKTLFVVSTSWPWGGIREAIGNIRRPPNQSEMVGVQELFFTALAFIGTIFSWIKLRPLYAMWMTGSWLLVASATFIQSAPRYALTMFPVFMLFALAGKSRYWTGIITAWSLLFLALFSSVFVRGWWAF